MKKILITGGAGFIGSNFARYVLGKGHTVLVLDALTYAGHKETVPVHPKLTFRKADITNYKSMLYWVRNFKPDVVVNFAANSHVDRSLSGMNQAFEFMKTNHDGVLILANVCNKYGVYLHHISTDEVFGDLDIQDSPFNENSPYRPNNPYSVSKAAGDMALFAFARANPSFKWTLSNCTNNYGYYHLPEKMIPRFISRISSNKKVPVYTNKEGVVGSNIRDWIYVEDHCEAVYTIIYNHFYKGEFGEKYCIASGEELRNIDVAKMILQKMGKENWAMWVMPVKDRPGHDFRYALSTAKIRTKLGWEPKTPFSVGIDRTIKWYLGEGKEWLAKVSHLSRDVRRGQSQGV